MDKDLLIDMIIEKFEEITKISFEDYKLRNRLIIKAKAILDKIDILEDKMDIMKIIFKKSDNKYLKQFLAGYIIIYEPLIAKEIYEGIRDHDPIIGLLLNNFERDLEIVKKENIEKIKNYNLWKYNNNITYKIEDFI